MSLTAFQKTPRYLSFQAYKIKFHTGKNLTIQRVWTSTVTWPSHDEKHQLKVLQHGSFPNTESSTSSLLIFFSLKDMIQTRSHSKMMSVTYFWFMTSLPSQRCINWPSLMILCLVVWKDMTWTQFDTVSYFSSPPPRRCIKWTKLTNGELDRKAHIMIWPVKRRACKRWLPWLSLLPTVSQKMGV